MKFKKDSYPVQELASGEVLYVHAYTYSGSKSGPTVYLQANIHGPEICGTAVLIEQMHFLETQKNMPGKIIIVPCANPMAVNQVSYNSMIGRFNMQSGSNWNRIFKAPNFISHKEESEHFTSLRKSKNLSVETRLSATLRSLSSGADFVLDIHTTGSASVEHVFTFAWSHDAFASLQAKYHIELPDNDPVGAFDESHVLPFIKSFPSDTLPRVATWEVHHHGDLNAEVVHTRRLQLTKWLDSTRQAVSKKFTRRSSRLKPIILKDGLNLFAPIGGYYSWLKAVGDSVKKGEVYAMVYKPVSGKIQPVKAARDFILLGTYGVGAQAQGEQIGLIGIIK